MSRAPSLRISPGRIDVAARVLTLTALLVGAVGVGAWALSWPLLTSTVGPTAYVFAVHPRSEMASLRNAIVGHATALAVGVAMLAVFGLLRASPDSATAAPSPRHILAAVLAVGATACLLELFKSHHAPAAATALLVATGLARPGAPLIGLVLGLALVTALGPLCGRWGFAAPQTARAQAEEKL